MNGMATARAGRQHLMARVEAFPPGSCHIIMHETG